MIEQLVKLKSLSLNPQEAIDLVDKNIDHKFDMVKIYNTIFSTAYNISTENIDNILKDIDWQIVCIYGLNACFLVPSHPANYTLQLFTKIVSDKSLLDIIKMVSENVTDVLNFYNNVFNKFLNHEDKEIKFIMFKSFIDIAAFLIANMVGYSMADKNIEEELKKKILPM